jgi:hypothetical protein
MAFDAAINAMHVQLPPDPRFKELRFRRGLYHLALNYVAQKWGVDFALESRFDPVRTYVRAARRGEKWPYAQTPRADDSINRYLELHVVEDAPGLVVKFVSFSDDFFMDVLNTGEIHAWAARCLPKDTGCL